MENNQKKAWAAVVAEIERRIKALGRGGFTRVGELLGVSRGTISKWVNNELKGERKSFDQVVDIMRKLEIDPAPYYPSGDEDTDFTEIPWLRATASMGGGSEEGSKLIRSHLSFQTGWLLNKSTSLKSLVVISASGGSMEPTIPDGSVVLIDESKCHDLVDGKIYFVVHGKGIFLKPRDPAHTKEPGR